jgi:hypothetical protein
MRSNAANARAALAQHDPGEVLPDGVLPWAALGPGRLHATIITARPSPRRPPPITPRKLLPEHGGLLARAKAYRLGDNGECFTVADCYAACDLIDAVVNDAASIASRSVR